MKKSTLVLTLALLAGAAQAGIVGTAPNDRGGRIVLADEVGYKPQCAKAYTYTADGETMNGCWDFSKSLSSVTIAWRDGDNRAYPISIFVMTSYFTKRYQEPLQRQQREQQARQAPVIPYSSPSQIQLAPRPQIQTPAAPILVEPYKDCLAPGSCSPLETIRNLSNPRWPI